MSRQELFLRLRTEYPVFEYRKAHFEVQEGQLHLEYLFVIEGIGQFRPTLDIPLPRPWETCHPQIVERLVFLIGMVELISYWKAVACPKILVSAGGLNPSECAFWKRLYWGGLGEFFYTNGIDTTEEDFVEIEPRLSRPNLPYASTLADFPPQKEQEAAPILIPVGGGKDSVVTLEALRSAGVPRLGFAVNPNEAVRACMDRADLDERIEVKRRLDPFLLELNQKGYLNGHTPFSALLGFVSLLAAYLSGASSIALSNEGSANESTVHGAEVNHQFSKSTAFESAFQQYIFNQIGLRIRYFSFLRPLSELSIARWFAKFPQYHTVFRSCNRGSKQSCWCGHCPKCLFVSLILAPFVGVKTVESWLGHAIFSDPERVEELRELVGLTEAKPFECVGTVAEVRMALALLSRREQTERPLLLQTYLEWVQNGQVPEEVLEGNIVFIPKEQYDRLFGCYYNSKEFPPRLIPLLPRRYADGLEAKLALPWEEPDRDWETFLRPEWKQQDLLSRMQAALRAQPKKQLILGFGREGQAWLEVLAQVWQGLEPTCEIGIADANPVQPAVRAWAEQLGLPIRWHIGGDPLEWLSHYSICYKSPGISLKQFEPGTKPGTLRAIPTIQIQGQMDWFLQFQSRKTIGVTGSKGKSTTTSLVDAMLSQVEPSVYLLGNIGRAVFTVASELREEDAVALELSCHQLEHCFHAPHIAVLTNLYPEHLDHYRNYEAYREAKFHLLTAQTPDDWAVLPLQEEVLMALNGRVLSRIWLVSEEDVSLETIQDQYPALVIAGICTIQKSEPEAVCLRWQCNPNLGVSYENWGTVENLSLHDLPFALQGRVHAWDYAFAATAIRCYGGTRKAIVQGARLFRGLPHRCSLVGSWNGIRFVNDSISTIPATCVGAVELLHPDALFVGGMDRGIDLTPLVEELRKGEIPLILCMPDTGKQIAEALENSWVEVHCIETLEEGVEWVFKRLKPGACALFSPAAASYHLYRNFEDRGRAFECAVRSVATRLGFCEH